MRTDAALLVFLLLLAMPMGAKAQRIGGGDLTFSPAGAAPVIFSHEMHVKDKGLKCTSCHYQIFQMTKGSSKIDMGLITKGNFCGKCHNGQKAFDAGDARNCSRCHR